MPDAIRFGLIGAGRIAQTYAEAFADSSHADLVAVADCCPAAARSLAHQARCPGYTSYREMLRESQFDAVVVCTPPATHPEVCLDCLAHHRHVLCEKPLSIDILSAQRMVAAARRAGLLLTMAAKFRYVEDVRQARSMVLSGLLGNLVLLENTFASQVDMSGRWNADPAVSGGGVLIDNGTHAVDLARYFLGPLAQVHVVEGKRSQGLAVEDTVRLFVQSVGGVMGSIDLSWSMDKALEGYLTLYGTHGTMSVGWAVSRYRLTSSRDWVMFGPGYDKVKAFRRQIDNFAKAIRGEEALLITDEDAVASVEVIATAYASLRQNPWLAIETRPAPSSTSRHTLAHAAGVAVS